MKKKFKWNMFYTSFLPLWISVIVYEMFCVGEVAFKMLKTSESVRLAIENTLQVFNVKLAIIITLTITFTLIFSMISINNEIREKRGAKTKEIGTILVAKKEKKVAAEFLLAYILPMVSFDFNTIQGLVLFLIYFIVLCYLCIKNNNIYTNIFLEIKGYSMYVCDIECMVMGEIRRFDECIIISANDLTQTLPREVEYFDFDNSIYIDLGGRDE